MVACRRPLLLLAFLSAVVPSRAEPPAALKRIAVYHADLAEPGREAVVVQAELAPGAHAGRHTHPGDEIAYVVEGAPEVTVEGESARRLKPGDAFVVKAGRMHDVRNDGSAPVRVIAVYVVEKGKPLATPAK
jgi:quercetin dioxygenase-like cupin family protein